MQAKQQKASIRYKAKMYRSMKIFVLLGVTVWCYATAYELRLYEYVIRQVMQVPNVYSVVFKSADMVNVVNANMQNLRKLGFQRQQCRL